MPEPDTLRGCWKGRFAFRLGTTSFIYRDSYAANAARLAPCLDSLELLFFDRNPEALPAAAEIQALAAVAERGPLSYNVHLPLDLPLGDEDATRRQAALKILGCAIARARSLAPSTWTLHLEPDRPRLQGRSLGAWRQRMHHSCQCLLEQSALPAAHFSVENLLYPFEWVEPLVTEFGFSICMDTGHLWRQGQDPLRFWQRHHHAITIVHLQGVRGGRDHQGLDCLDAAQRITVQALLAELRCEVILELFSLPQLNASLALLDSWHAARTGA